MFQFTLPRGERLIRPVRYLQGRKVSIHAPTRGATWKGAEVKDHLNVSIHAPTRGATPQSYLTTTGCTVSIHAPTRGATEKDPQAF